MAVMCYRTQDGLADYGFSIEFHADTGWRVYVIFEPLHQGHGNSLDLPYQSIDRDGRRYVDWPEKLDFLADAKTVAALWAELAQRYQRIQEQRALHVELIQRYRRTRGQTKASPTGPGRPGDAIGAGEARLEHQDRGSAIPHPRTSAKS